MHQAGQEGDGGRLRGRHMPRQLGRLGLLLLQVAPVLLQLRVLRQLQLRRVAHVSPSASRRRRNTPHARACRRPGDSACHSGSDTSGSATARTVSFSRLWKTLIVNTRYAVRSHTVSSRSPFSASTLRGADRRARQRAVGARTRDAAPRCAPLEERAELFGVAEARPARHVFAKLLVHHQHDGQHVHRAGARGLEVRPEIQLQVLRGGRVRRAELSDRVQRWSRTWLISRTDVRCVAGTRVPPPSSSA